ncbi:MAG: C40 family peptidase [Spirochaetia bacterium]|nr:C40 family peptidase [Spirochaetia bacterium]
MKKLFCIFAVFLGMLCQAAAQQEGEIRPPAWMLGEWRNESGGQSFLLGMRADDIIWDGSSLSALVRSKDLVFSQKVTNTSYEIYFKFPADGFWYRETFSKPKGNSLTSSFADSDGRKKQYAYTSQSLPQAAETATDPQTPAPTATPVVTPVTADPAASREEATRDKIVTTARKYLGARYIYGAQNPPRAFDCSGFVGQAYMEGAGFKLPRTSKALAVTGRAVGRKDIRPGDIIYFDINGWGVISHVALVLDSKNMIHAVSENRGMAITSLDDKWYRPKIAGYRTLFSNGQIASPSRDGISVRAALADKPVSEILLSVTGWPEKSTDSIEMAMESGLHFTLMNKTGGNANFDVYFYQVGTDRAKGDHERISVKANESKELLNAFFAEKPGQYRVEIRKTGGGAALVEKTWNIVQ